MFDFAVTVSCYSQLLTLIYLFVPQLLFDTRTGKHSKCISSKGPMSVCLFHCGTTCLRSTHF